MCLSFVAFVLIFVHLVDSRSVCDEKDLLIFIDSTTIQANNEDVLAIIDTIITEGAHEHDGIGIIVYGDLPEDEFGRDKDIVLVNSAQSKRIHKKRKQTKFINDRLELVFASFGAGGATKRVSLSDAISIAERNNQIGRNKEEERLVVFQHDESMANGDENCGLVNEFGNDIYFILDDKGDFVCDDGDAERTYDFAEIVNDVSLLFDFTCPTERSGDPAIGKFKLSKKGNFIELDTIITCELHFDEELALTDESFIIVNDEINDDANFDVGAFLFVSSEEEMAQLPEECQYPVFKINNIEDGANANELKLYVTIPVLLEYMQNAKIKTHDMALKTAKAAHYQKANAAARRLGSYSVGSSVSLTFGASGSGVDLGITASAGVSVSLDFDWCLVWPCDVYGVTVLALKMTGQASFTPYFNVDKGYTVSKSASKKFSKDLYFTVYAIPVLVTPHIEFTISVSGEVKFTMNLEFPIASSYTLGVAYGSGFTKSFSYPSLPDIDLFDSVCSAGSVTVSASLTVELGVTLYGLLTGYIQGILESTNTLKPCPGCVSTENTFKMLIGGSIGVNILGLSLTVDFGTANILNPYTLYSNEFCVSSAKGANLPQMISYPEPQRMFADNMNKNAYDAYDYSSVIQAIFVVVAVLVVFNVFAVLYFCCGGAQRKVNKYSAVNIVSGADTDFISDVDNEKRKLNA